MLFPHMLLQLLKFGENFGLRTLWTFRQQNLPEFGGKGMHKIHKYYP